MGRVSCGLYGSYKRQVVYTASRIIGDDRVAGRIVFISGCVDLQNNLRANVECNNGVVVVLSNRFSDKWYICKGTLVKPPPVNQSAVSCSVFVNHNCCICHFESINGGIAVSVFHILFPIVNGL
jgi:hypothetical protein